MDETKIKELLLSENYISAEDLKMADGYAKERKASLTDSLLALQLITKDLLHQAIAESLGMPFVDLAANPPSKEDILLIPKSLAEKENAIFYKQTPKTVTVASAGNLPPEALMELQKIFIGKKIIIAYADPEAIALAAMQYRPALETRFGEIIKAGGKVAPEIIDQILDDALALRASDIHCEPQEKGVLIRFRIDGVLHEAGRVPKEYYENIVNRIKVQARLRIDEHLASQDGAIHFSGKQHQADLRVSIVPTLDGEKVVIRVLAEYVRDFTLADIGLAARDQQYIVDTAHKPFGMVLVTGPTGSGKTTSLYSLVKLLNDSQINITTIEDPVEYKIAGVNQIQVNAISNLTFAKGLKAIARQDPNIILVGEIRDLETADIAVNAALTGHLMLSTFHANDSAAVIPRLLNMGIEPFLLSSTLELIVAQRLVRRVCESCRVSRKVSPADLNTMLPNAAKYFPEKALTLFAGKGCNNCSGTGYKGRVGLFELLKVTPEMADLILTSPSSKQIWQLAKSQGCHSLFEDGVEKVKSGLTTLEELLRVVKSTGL